MGDLHPVLLLKWFPLRQLRRSRIRSIQFSPGHRLPEDVLEFSASRFNIGPILGTQLIEHFQPEVVSLMHQFPNA